jgi:hypothetical protein
MGTIKLYSLTKLGNFAAVTDDIAANSSDMIQPNTSSIPVSVVEEIRYIVKRQELELEDLRNRLDNVVRL